MRLVWFPYIHGRGQSVSVWLERDDLLSPGTAPHYPELGRDIEADELVVGGGMAGMHIAYELLSSGVKRVVIVEDGSEPIMSRCTEPLTMRQRSRQVKRVGRQGTCGWTTSTTISSCVLRPPPPSGTR